MAGQRAEDGRPAPSGGWRGAAYAAAAAAFGYALVSLYWAAGGQGLISTVGGFAERMARQGGAVALLAEVAVVVAKAAGGVLALALARPWGQAVPRRWLLGCSAAASALLVAWGSVNVVAGTLVLTGMIRPAGAVDRTALLWHAAVWDLWFLVWGILLALATAGKRRHTAAGDRRPSPERDL